MTVESYDKAVVDAFVDELRGEFSWVIFLFLTAVDPPSPDYVEIEPRVRHFVDAFLKLSPWGRSNALYGLKEVVEVEVENLRAAYALIARTGER